MMTRPAEKKFSEVNWDYIHLITGNTFMLMAHAIAASEHTWDFTHKIDQQERRILFLFRSVPWGADGVTIRVLSFHINSRNITNIDFKEADLKVFVALSGFADTTLLYGSEYSEEADNLIKKSLINFSLDTHNTEFLTKLSSPDWKEDALSLENNSWDVAKDK